MHNNFQLVNLDTDSLSFCKKDGVIFSEEEESNLLKDLNDQFPKEIHWESEGQFQKVVILKAKNYILQKDGKIIKKGSSLKSSKTEKGLKDFMSEVIDCLLQDNQESIIDVYHKYIKDVFNVIDITKWCSKKTVTEKVVNGTRKNETKVLDALKNQTIQLGEKYLMYFTKDKTLQLASDWSKDGPNHDSFVLLKKLYKTLEIFKNVINIKDYPKYHLKKQQKMLGELIGNS